MAESSIIVTRHAQKRAKQRLGWSKPAIANMALKAYDEGILHKETFGKLKNYLSSIYYAHKNKHGGEFNIRIYGQVLYFFKDNRLVTLYKIDKKYYKYLDK